MDRVFQLTYDADDEHAVIEEFARSFTNGFE